ncbi:hypothetical protein TUMEXPCC7403_02450 [Tumidithrix helvetica PCC 7403]|uniref:hypothetical protein n=1 Tax=Tumidithrix helvetica TaxID=3457545 RepID=UPI003C80AA96
MGLVAECLEGEAAIRSAIAELIALGYIRRVFVRSPNGCFQSWDFEIYERPLPPYPEQKYDLTFEPDRDYPDADNPVMKNPQLDEPVVDNPLVDNPDVDNPLVENRVHINKDLTNTVLTNTLSPLVPSRDENQTERENFETLEAEFVPVESAPIASDLQGGNIPELAKAIAPGTAKPNSEDNFSAPPPEVSKFEISSFESANFENTEQKLPQDASQVVTVTVESRDAEGNKAPKHVRLDISDPDFRDWIVGYCIHKMPDQPERDSLNEDLLVSSLARKPETQRRYVRYCQTLAERAESDRLIPMQPVRVPPVGFMTIGAKCAMLRAKWVLPLCRKEAIAQAQELGFEVSDEGIALPDYADPETLLDEWEPF